MANESIRIRTTPGQAKNIRVKIEQDFDFLEILSLRISQEDLYQTFCSNYGVVVGRVIANRGFGVPNAKVSIFIPISDEDQKNVLLKDFYPFKTPYEKDSRSIRYNLLLSKSTCELNAAVGTFPTKEEVLNDEIILEVFDKYYKYTTKTNDSGDFMIFGVPVGTHTAHMDVDFSDTGKLSIRPYDLIAEGYPEKSFESKTKFKTSTNLDSLPQLKVGNVSVDVIPFWGSPENCEIGISRVDFDTGFNVTTTSLFFGSIFTDTGKMAVNRGCNPKNDQGQQEEVRTGPGNIQFIRVKEYNPEKWINNAEIEAISLEKFDIEGGDIIDENGVFAVTVPMNIGHVITDEFGNTVPSPDPTIGVPTKAMYRMKVKFTEASEASKIRTATMFFPSLGEQFGGTIGMVDTGSSIHANGTQDQRFTDDISQYDKIAFPNSRIELDFHLFEWKQVYTVAHYIKKYKKGANRFSFVGIKNVDQLGSINYFPFNNAIWKFNILYYLIAYIVDYLIFLFKMLITLISLCIVLCVLIKIQWSPSITILGNSYTLFSINWTLINFCWKICPFAWLGGLIPSFTLPCEGAPNDGYEIPPGGGTFASCNPNSCGGSTLFCDCKNTPDNACANCGGFGCIKLDVTGTNTGDNICLQVLEKWKCCVKLNLVEQFNVIRRVFTDSWIIGTAYLFQFKYKRKLDSNGSVKKEKFCGPGADHRRGDNYVQNVCCIDTDPGGTCDKCLLRGPGQTRSITQFRDYHEIRHNTATQAGKTGAVDIDDIIYCNALMSTKIVSLGRIEMCLETLEDIERATQVNFALKSYTQNNTFFTGTFYENGWDAGYWVNYLKETSYEDSRDVLFYLGTLANPPCSYSTLFYNSGLIDGNPCHEYELRPNPYFYMKEVSKIHVDIELDNNDEFTPQSTANPYADINDPPQYGGFNINLETANKFQPCGGDGSSGGCNGLPSNHWTNTANPSPNEADSDGWDRFNSQSNRNNRNTKSNIPYYYFGINPGKTAIAKLRKEYFTNG